MAGFSPDNPVRPAVQGVFAIASPLNQVFVGNLDPDDLRHMPPPWYQISSTSLRIGSFQRNYT